MIIARAPLRISIFGGGSDFKSFYKKNKAAVLSLSIKKYVYIIVKESYSKKFIISYSRKEVCSKISEIKHPLIRETLKYFRVKKPLEIVSISDIPGKGSGLGSSSAFTCAIVMAIANYKKIKISRKKVAKIASFIEINKCKSNIGVQDHYASAIGGFNLLEFKSNDTVKIKKIKKKNLNKFFLNFYLISTNIFRSANKILSIQEAKNNIINKNMQIKKLVNIAYKVYDIIIKKKNLENVDIGDSLDLSWKIKKKISKSISKKKIDKLYNFGINSGSTGGKLLGAGGGGFILFYVPKKNKKLFQKKTKFLNVTIPTIDNQGVKLISMLNEK